MKIPLKVTYKELTSSPAIDAAIAQHAAHLESHFAHIISCRVTVEGPHQHHRRGTFAVRVDVSVPAREVVGTCTVQHAPGRPDIQSAMKKAFLAVDRQLREHVEHLRSPGDRERVADLVGGETP